MGIPWNNAAEYEALHDLVSGRINWYGVTPTICPHGGSMCADMLIVNGRYADHCPRFGGAKQTDHEGATPILCKSDRFFIAAGKPIPTEHGTSRKKGK